MLVALGAEDLGRRKRAADNSACVDNSSTALDLQTSKSRMISHAFAPMVEPRAGKIRKDTLGARRVQQAHYTDE